MKPSVGRIVHMRNILGECIAAIVTRVHPDGQVDLTLFPPATSGDVYTSPTHFTRAAEERLGEAVGYHWPERVE